MLPFQNFYVIWQHIEKTKKKNVKPDWIINTVSKYNWIMQQLALFGKHWVGLHFYKRGSNSKIVIYFVSCQSNQSLDPICFEEYAKKIWIPEIFIAQH